jgi:hypothetical protein
MSRSEESRKRTTQADLAYRTFAPPPGFLRSPKSMKARTLARFEIGSLPQPSVFQCCIVCGFVWSMFLAMMRE